MASNVFAQIRQQDDGGQNKGRANSVENRRLGPVDGRNHLAGEKEKQILMLTPATENIHLSHD
jgi:hypothetical protein